MSDNQSDNSGAWAIPKMSPYQRYQFAEQQLREVKNLLASAEQEAEDAKRELIKSTKDISWKNVLCTSHIKWNGMRDDAIREAQLMGYDYIEWNNQIFHCETGIRLDLNSSAL